MKRENARPPRRAGAIALAGAFRVLASSGVLAFTLETHDGSGIVLGEGLRYAHAT